VRLLGRVMNQVARPASGLSVETFASLPASEWSVETSEEQVVLASRYVSRTVIWGTEASGECQTLHPETEYLELHQS
jgi:hypothetical protein